MTEYKIVVKDGSGNKLGEFAQFRGLKFGSRLNNYGTCTFQVPVSDSKISSLIALRRYTVHIYRDGSLVWAGEQAIRSGALDSKGDNWVTIQCFDWFEQLLSRYTDGDDRIFTAVDAGEIAWTLIDESQAFTHGDYGITMGTIETTMDRDRTYKNQNIGQAIIDLSNVLNGFDFEINTSKVFNVYDFQGVDRTNSVILEYGVNVSAVRIVEDFSKPVNKAIILGDSGDYTDPLRVERENTTDEGLYKIREALSNEMTVIEIATLEEKGDALLRKYGSVLVKLSLTIVRNTVTIDELALGDLVRIKIQSGIYDIDESYRVFEWSVSYDENNVETLDLVLAKFILA